MLKYRNFGKKSLNEIKEKLAGLGLSLGQKFDPALLESADANKNVEAVLSGPVLSAEPERSE